MCIRDRNEDKDKIEALDAGADDYVTKPFSVEELLALSLIHIFVYTCPGAMGGDTAEEMGFQTVLRPGTAAAGAGMESDGASMDAGALPESLSATSAEDTRKLAEWLLSEQVLSLIHI